MIDFRYHALSLVAVFLALGIGIVLGVTLGDSLVSEADQGVRNSLRGDVENARDQARDARAEVRERDRLIAAAVPVLLDRRLEGKRVQLVGTDDLPGGVSDGVRGSVEGAAGSLDSTAALGLPGELEKVLAVAGEEGRRAVGSPQRARALGAEFGRSLAVGGKLAQRLKEEFPDRYEGDFDGSDAVVIYRRPPKETKEGETPQAKRLRESAGAFERGLIAGLREDGVTVVGVEQTGTDPSQVGFYEDAGLSSVDNVNESAGEAALAIALAGTRQGSFGTKDSADRPLPQLAE